MTLSKTMKKIQFFLAFLLCSRVWTLCNLHRFLLCKMRVLLSEDSYYYMIPMFLVQEDNLSPLLLI